MIALDTNVLARAIAAEIDADTVTKAQRRRAQALLSSGRQLFVPITVIEELESVLRGAYGMPPDEIADLFADMLAVENLTVDRIGAVNQAIAWYRRGMDFSDALHLAQSGLCTGLATFDKKFSSAARRLDLKPPVSAPG
ncbi:MAG: type II toxin-antitoxin system VapC family toxin [Betaproteobacteria bacterium]|nr:type II toxin-antitoxin system VapC family toxin [Betaproteobacteria bacterium]